MVEEILMKYKDEFEEDVRGSPVLIFGGTPDFSTNGEAGISSYEDTRTMRMYLGFHLAMDMVVLEIKRVELMKAGKISVSMEKAEKKWQQVQKKIKEI